MSRRLRFARDPADGFTLVELLVALAVFALVATLLLAAIRSLASAQVRIDDRLASDEELHNTYQFLSLVMGRISPRDEGSAAGAKGRGLAFRGGASELQWVGVMPARHGIGGLHRFRLFLQPADSDNPSALVLQYAPLTNREQPLSSEPVESRVMVSEVQQVAFRYLDASETSTGWTSEWPHHDRLPGSIGLSLQFDSQAWPEMIVAVTLTGDSAVSGRIGAGPRPTVGPN